MAYFSMLLILLSATVCFSGQSPAPKMFIEEKTFDAKDIKTGDYLEHTFNVYNRGEAPLEISNVKTT